MELRSFLSIHLGMFAWAGGTTIVPWSIPLLYSAIGGLVAVGNDPLLLSMSLTLGALIGTCIGWFFSKYILHLTKPKTPPTSGIFYRIHHKSEQLYLYLQTTNKKWLLFILIAIGIQSSIPDIMIILAVRKKVSFPFFVGATLLGKLFVYVPFIYGIELIKILNFNR